MTTQTHTGRRNAGVAMVLALLLVAIMGITGAALWKRLHITFAEMRRVEDAEVTLHLAEAGLEKAVAMLRRDPAYPGESGTALGEGAFSVAVERTGSGSYRLWAEGVLESKPVVQHRTVLLGELTLGPGGRVSAYRWRHAKAQEKDVAAWRETAGTL